jgi:macrodomain Ter protein organizer (MatP/YcbG family)
MVVKKSKVADLIVQHVPKQLIMALSDAIYAASKRSYDYAKEKLDHRSTALGYDRHLNLNETIYEVFEANGCNPGKIAW